MRVANIRAKQGSKTARLYEKSSVFLLHSCIWPQAMYSDWEVWPPILHYKEAPFHWSNAQRFMANQFSCAKCSWLWLENLNSSTVLLTLAIYCSVCHSCTLASGYICCPLACKGQTSRKIYRYLVQYTDNTSKWDLLRTFPFTARTPVSWEITSARTFLASNRSPLWLFQILVVWSRSGVLTMEISLLKPAASWISRRYFIHHHPLLNGLLSHQLMSWFGSTVLVPCNSCGILLFFSFFDGVAIYPKLEDYFSYISF